MGRTSRAVESFLFYKAGVNVRGYYSLANYYYRNRPQYINNLNLVQMQGETDLTPFVAFALTGTGPRTGSGSFGGIGGGQNTRFP